VPTKSSSDEATRQDKPARVSVPKLPDAPDFGPRYRVVGAIGKGGMGVVFRAHDTVLDVDVALKVVRDADQEAAMARFHREIALARKITSPNVLRVYDLAEHDGLCFLSMEFVDGTDLAALLRTSGKLPLPRALQIFRQVCIGLVAAHEQGVVHRDLKPQNVLVDKDDRVRVADFGLARSIADSGMTASGAILGSPAYMSPEQVRGDPADERSDIYSLGVLLYQLVAGETPFRAETPHAVMEMRLHKKPPLLCDVVPDAPRHLEGIAAKCLALSPSARYATAGDVLAALDEDRAQSPAARPRRLRRRVAIAVVACGAVAAVAGAVVSGGGGRDQQPAARESAAAAPAAPAVTVEPGGFVTVLVLGFENRTSELGFDGTLDVVLEWNLRRSTIVDPFGGNDLREMATSRFPNAPIDVSLGERLVAASHMRVIVVRGVIERAGPKLAVSVEALDAASKRVVLAKKLEADAPDELLPQLARYAGELRETLGERLSEGERGRTEMSGRFDANHEVAQAFAVWTDVDTAITLMQRALTRDPDFVVAHWALAQALSGASRHREADVEYQKALAHADDLGERDRLRMVGDVYANSTFEFDRAIEAYQHILAKWPMDHDAEASLIAAYEGHGDLAKALELARRVSGDRPRDEVTREYVPSLELKANQPDRAADDARQLIAAFSHPYSDTYDILAIAEMMNGHRAQAIEAYAQMAKVDASLGALASADVAFAEGRLRDAIAILDRGIAADEANHHHDLADLKRALLAEVQLARGDVGAARRTAAAEIADPRASFRTALVAIAVGDEARSRATAARLANDPAPSSRAMAKLIEAEILRHGGKPTQAILEIEGAQRIADLAIGHVLLARSALDAKRFIDAYGELQTCMQRRGELALDQNDLPSYHDVPAILFDLARAQEGLHNPAAKASYDAFLAALHDPDPDFVLARTARARSKGAGD
jgi:tetratricopeptide (TPR) repeat protein